jgi:dipeptidyl aminopeptidase/acylaminoacyl peptidase
VLVSRLSNTGPRDLTGPEFDVGNRVHEYGGGSFDAHDGVVVFSHCGDDSLWLIDRGGAPRILARVEGCRFADLHIAGDSVIAVREDHRGVAAQTACAAIVRIQLDSTLDPQANEGVVLVCGSDFYASPRVSPNGQKLAWVDWDHPHMPWDHTRLKVATFGSAGSISNERIVAGQIEESILQPLWSPAGVLHFCSDRSGWWNVYAWLDEKAHALMPMSAEIGSAPWQFGHRHYGFLANAELFAAIWTQERRQLAILRPEGPQWLPHAFTRDHLAAFKEGIAYVASFDDKPDSVQWVEPGDPHGPELISRQAAGVVPVSDVSTAQTLRCVDAGGAECHALFYAPIHTSGTGPAGLLPPLVLTCHGGPTSARERSYSALIQWWTTRGFAVAEVNYAGSTGYGRAYRERLKGRWGQADVSDCVAVARHLAAEGRVDAHRMVIRGPSSGGLTALTALIHFEEVFAAGASHYGVTDLRALSRETHKFESRYIDWLVGPTTSEKRFEAQSPLSHVDRIGVPVVFFQGQEDKVVPPDQTRRMAAALRERGVRAEVHEFVGEGHGFRKLETLIAVLEAELAFVLSVLGPIDERPPQTG